MAGWERHLDPPSEVQCGSSAARGGAPRKYTRSRPVEENMEKMIRRVALTERHRGMCGEVAS
jgi:hypothetical protein